MSFRVEGQDFDQWVEKVQGDLRYLYKCCEKGAAGIYTVIASTIDVSWPTDGISEPWSAELGTSTLLELAASGISPSGVDSVIEIDSSTQGVIATLTIPAGDEFNSVLASIDVVPGEQLRVLTGAGGVRGLTVQMLFEGVGRGSGGLNITEGVGPT